jgi:hypothetical protein
MSSLIFCIPHPFDAEMQVGHTLMDVREGLCSHGFRRVHELYCFEPLSI